MKLIFSIDKGDFVCSVEGECVEYTVSSKANELMTVYLSIRIEDLKIVDNEDTTKIIPFPDASSGHIRIGGATKFNYTDKVVDVVFFVKGMYTTKEEACAAEMKEIMERSNK